MYEKTSESLISRGLFIKRIASHSAFVVAIMALSVLVGVIGFIALENKELEDAILHASYMLSGFGVIETPTSIAGKIFAGVFGLYASIFFLAAFSIMASPIVHRMLHKLHLDTDDKN